MNISYNNHYVQIELYRESPMFSRVLSYAEKHFLNYYQLSSSVLILDTEERVKKDYLINWIFYASMQEDKYKLKTLLSHAYLPIRIKFLSKNEALQKIKVSLKMVNLNKVVLKFDNQSRVAKRYIKTNFEKYYMSETQEEIHLQGEDENFWEKIMNMIETKVIHNIAIDFDYDDFRKFNSAFLTQEEKQLIKYYKDLDCEIDDSFEKVKRQYFKLAKIYHPDKYTTSSVDTNSYSKKFREITHAYKSIKKHCNNG